MNLITKKVWNTVTLLDLYRNMDFGDSKGTRLERAYAERYKIPIVEKW